MQDREIIIPQVLDKDTHIERVSNMCATEISNLRVNNSKVQEGLDGTLQIDNPTPIVDTTVMRSVEDEKTATIFEFHRNTGESVDSIVQYLPTIPERQMVMQTSAFNFEPNLPITSCVIQDQYLMFSDDTNPPRYLDWVKGNRTDKKLSATILFGKPEAGVNKIFTDLTVYTMTFNIPNLAPITTVIWTVSGTSYEDKLWLGAEKFRDEFNANTDINPYFRATNCGCGEVTIEELAASGDADGNITTCSIAVTVAPDTQDPKALVIYNNVYPQTITDFHINRARRTPQKQPTTRLFANPDSPDNRISQLNPQFAFRLVYTDNHYTAFSPISLLALENTDCLGKMGLQWNGIEIDFTDLFTNPLSVDAGGILKDADTLQEIAAVEIAVRDTNISVWEIAKRIERCQFGLHRQWWDFYNDEVRLSFDQTEAPTQKPFDAVPLLNTAETQATIASGEGVRTYMGNTLENYDNVCPDIRIPEATTVEVVNCSRRWRVTIWGQIYCPYTSGAFLNQQQCVWQMEDGTTGWGGMGTTGVAGYVHGLTTNYQQILPSKGWIGYFAGTKHQVVSTQWVEDGAQVQYADLSAGSFLGDTDDNRADIRETLRSRTVWQRWVFEGVEGGQRLDFRVGSHWCSIGDTLGKGQMYDLSIGNLYQGTSTYIDSMIPYIAGAVPTGVPNDNATYAQFHWKEIQITTPYDTSTSEQGELNFGKVNIVDMTDPSGIDSTWVAGGYVVDARGSIDPEDLSIANRVEYLGYFAPIAGVALSPAQYPEVAIVGAANNYTDHNGYFFGGNNQTTAYGNDEPSLVIWGWDSLGNRSDVKGSNISCYAGGLNDLVNGTLTSTTIRMAKGLGLGIRDNAFQEFICWTQNSDIYDAGTTVSVTVADQNGDLLAGVLSVLSLVGRFNQTDINGVVEVFRYSKDASFADPAVVATQWALGLGSGCCINLETFGQFTDLDGGNTPYFPSPVSLPITPPFLVTVNYDEVFNILKHGSTVYLGVVYYDEVNRCTPVETTQFALYSVPFWTQTDGNNNYYLTWEIYSLPPSWAKKYQIVVAENPYQYVQFIVDKVRYIVKSGNALTEVETNFQSGAATEIHISTNSIALFNEQNKNSSVQYTFTQGDRLRFIRDNNGAITSYVDVPILSYADGYLVIDNNTSFPEIFTGYLMEIYNQIQVSTSELIFYEAGMCYPIIDDGGTLYHGKGEDNATITFTAQDQTSTLPATGFMLYTNTYQHTRTMATNQVSDLGWKQWTPLIESMNISDFYPSANLSIGRPNAVNQNNKQVRFDTMIRYCNPYYPNTVKNGLCQFELLSRQTFDTNMNQIQYVSAPQGVLVVIGKTGVITIYLGQSQMVAQNVAGIIALNSEVLGGWRSLSNNYGTRHLMSCVTYQGQVYWYDANNKCLVHYTTGGVYPFNKNAEGLGGIELEIRRLSAQYGYNDLLGSESNLVFAAVDKNFKEYVIRFADIDSTENYTTYTYDLLNQVWRGNYNLGRNMMAGTEAGLVSFNINELWEHDKDPEAVNVFYGDNYSARVKMALNKDVMNVKTFEAITVYCSFRYVINGIWFAPAPPAAPSVYGIHPQLIRNRESWINETWWKAIQGGLHASFRRDANSPVAQFGAPTIATGEKMITRWLSVELICNNRKRYVLESVSYLFSTNHKRNI